MVAPVIPGLTDHEMPAIVKAAAQAGARSAGYVLVRLPMAVAGLFSGLAGASLPRAEGQGARSHPRGAKRPAQRFAVRRPDERRGPPGRADRAVVPILYPPSRAQPTPLAGLARSLPPAGIGTTAAQILRGLRLAALSILTKVRPPGIRQRRSGQSQDPFAAPSSRMSLAQNHPGLRAGPPRPTGDPPCDKPG